MVEVTWELMKQASVYRYVNLPDDVRLLAKQCVLDWFASTLPGLQEPTEQSDHLQLSYGRRRSTVLSRRSIRREFAGSAL